MLLLCVLSTVAKKNRYFLRNGTATDMKSYGSAFLLFHIRYALREYACMLLSWIARDGDCVREKAKTEPEGFCSYDCDPDKKS